jgi:hypothetical protein
MIKDGPVNRECKCQGDTIVQTVKDSDSDAYENVGISESDDICEIEESDTTIFETQNGKQ